MKIIFELKDGGRVGTANWDAIPRVGEGVCLFETGEKLFYEVLKVWWSNHETCKNEVSIVVREI